MLPDVKGFTAGPRAAALLLAAAAIDTCACNPGAGEARTRDEACAGSAAENAAAYRALLLREVLPGIEG